MQHTPTLSYDFPPDPDRARALDRRMHLGLADSLEHVIEQTRGSGLDLTPLEPIVARLRDGGRLPPAGFGWYYELGTALFDADEAGAREAADRLAQTGPRPDIAPVIALDDPHVTRHGQMYLRRMGRDTMEDGIVAPPPALVAAFRQRLAAGFALLERAVPELAGEVDVLVREVLLATGQEGAEVVFDGASYYQLWGLLMLNPQFHTDPVAVADVLAHESAHSLLFGFTYDEPLVLNPDTEFYPSPLRQDPRPMDGIYHAAFVSARMCWAMSRVADCRDLDSDIRDRAAQAAERDAANFHAGAGVIEEHGRLSDVGAAVLAGATAYMTREDA